MLSRPPDCQGCPLHDQDIAIGFMNPEGSGALGLYVCAEALGDHEARDGLPLRPQAPAGSVFERTLRRASISRESLALSNTLHCRPGKANLLEHQPYEFAAINHCKVHMDREIARFQPKAILALGNVPLRTFTGFCGKRQTITAVRGFILDNLRYPGIPVISTYHPSYIARDKSNLLGVLRLDLLRAVALAKAGGKFQRPVKRYTKFPNITEAESWLAWLVQHPDLLITYDIETDDSISGEDESALRVNAEGGVEFTPLKPEYADAPEEEKEKEEAVASEYKYINNYSRITQIQFSVVGDGDAIILPWDNGPFTALAQRVMAMPNPKAGWNNWGFDDPLLRANGAGIGGENLDLMWAWHHLQPDLPRGLQYAMSFYFPEAEPWKHRSADDPGEYGGDDVNYLRQAGPQIVQALKDRGIWGGFERHVLRLQPVLVGATERGMPVDDVARLALGEKVDRLRAGVDGELQGMFPDELRNCEPKGGYVNDRIAEKRIAEDNLDIGERWVRRRFAARKNNKRVAGFTKPVSESTSRSSGVTLGGPTISGVGMDDEGVGEFDSAAEAGFSNSETVERWCRIQPFLPNSSQQILKYIRWKREEEIVGMIARYRASARWKDWPEKALREMAERNAIYKVPKKFREDKDTTEKKELERLGARTGDGFFSLVVEHREYGKVRSTYVDGWAPAVDGRAHPTFTFAPATGQLSSVKPASMTMPKPGGRETLAEARKTDLAHWCRGMVVAPPGFRLVFFDKKSFHATTLGFNAQDPTYMRITKIDIHSFVTANFMWMNEKAAFLATGLPGNPESWLVRSDEELKELLGMVRWRWEAVRDKKAKPTILGIGLGLGDNKCYEMNKRDEINPRGFESKMEVTRFKNVLKGLFGRIFAFHTYIKNLAHTQGFLKTRHGYMRWFFDVYHNVYRSGQWVQEAGRDAEAAIALPVQNDAHGMLKEEMLVLEGLGLMERFGFQNVVHDELQFCCPDQYVEECLFEVPRVMNRPSSVLVDSVVAPGGLVCLVEGSVGRSWDEMEKVKG